MVRNELFEQANQVNREKAKSLVEELHPVLIEDLKQAAGRGNYYLELRGDKYKILYASGNVTRFVIEELKRKLKEEDDLELKETSSTYSTAYCLDWS